MLYCRSFLEAVGGETNGFRDSIVPVLPLRQTWESDPELTKNEASQYGTEEASESAESIVALRDLRLRRHEEDWLCGCAVEVSFGHFSLL